MEVCIDARTVRRFLQQKCGKKLPGVDPVLQARENDGFFECPKCQRVAKGHQLTVRARQRTAGKGHQLDR